MACFKIIRGKHKYNREGLIPTCHNLSPGLGEKFGTAALSCSSQRGEVARDLPHSEGSDEKILPEELHGA